MVIERKIAGLLERIAARAYEAARQLRATRPNAEAKIEEQPLRVLLVDDDDDQMELLAQLLAKHATVFTASSALNAIDRARRERVDVIVTDLHMPDVDGFGLLQLVRGDSQLHDIPCLLLTGNGTPHDKLTAFGLGADDYLTKPVDPNELIARVKRRLSDVHRLREERRLQEIDELTGLDNRRAFRRRLAEACATAKRSGRPLSVAMIDADGLKSINDTWGHAAGDRAIEAIAASLARSKRGGDCAARLGGDEFALVLPDTDEVGARQLCERIESVLTQIKVDVAGITIQVHVSTGVATLDGDGDDGVLARADASLYACKRAHKSSGSIKHEPPNNLLS